jgi:hypothetical protein
MKKIFDTFSWAFLILFALPTFLIMGSWKSLPGDPMYPVKLGLEQTLLFFVKPSYATEATLNVKYTERRLADAKILLANDGSGRGLSYLSSQIVATKAVIDRAPSAEAKKQLATQYVATLRVASQELSQQKQSIARQQQNQLTFQRGNTVRPTQGGSIQQQPTNTPEPSVTGTPDPGPGDVGGQIDDTQTTIDNTIHDLEHLSQSLNDSASETPTPMLTSTPEPTPTPEHRDNSDNRSENSNANDQQNRNNDQNNQHNQDNQNASNSGNEH